MRRRVESAIALFLVGLTLLAPAGAFAANEGATGPSQIAPAKRRLVLPTLRERSRTTPEASVYGQVAEVRDSELLVRSALAGSAGVTAPEFLVTVRANGDTVVQKDGQAVSFTQIKVGDQIGAFGASVSDSILLALKIEILAPPPPPSVLYGVVMEVRTTELLLGSGVLGERSPDPPPITVEVPPDCSIRRDGVPIPLSSILPGDRVTVVVRAWVDNGRVIAESIDIYVEPPPRPMVWGQVVELRPNELVVRSFDGGTEGGLLVTVRVNDQTRITKNGEAIGFNDIQVGDTLFAAGTLLDASTLLAESIEIYIETPPRPMVWGAVVEIAPNELKVRSFDIGRDGSEQLVTVRVSDQTTITKNGEVVGFNDIQVGDMLFAVGTLLDASTLLAESIEIYVETPPQPSVWGEVVEIGPNELKVRSFGPEARASEQFYFVRVNEATRIIRNGEVIGFGDIRIGHMVFAFGTLLSESILLAESLEVIEGGVVEPHLAGTVVEVRSSEILVQLYTARDFQEAPPVVVRVSPTTAIVKDGQLISISAIAVGDQVQAKGAWESESLFHASRVEIGTSPPPPQPEIFGQVESIGSNELSVSVSSGRENGSPVQIFTVRVDSSTDIKKEGLSISFADIRVGDQVHVAGSFVSDSIILATAIKVLMPPPLPEPFHGVVEETRREARELVVRISHPIALSGLSDSRQSPVTAIVRVTPVTEIVRTGQTLTFEEIAVGNEVWVSGEWINPVTVSARRIEVWVPSPGR